VAGDDSTASPSSSGGGQTSDGDGLWSVLV
jgi:hypothetical protein